MSLGPVDDSESADGTRQIPVLGSHGTGVKAKGKTTLVYDPKRSQEPWVGCEGTAEANQAQMLWGGPNGATEHTDFKNEHGGVGLFVRTPMDSASPPLAAPPLFDELMLWLSSAEGVFTDDGAVPNHNEKVRGWANRAAESVALQFRAYPGQTLPDELHNAVKTLPHVTLRACADACLGDEAMVCRSFDYTPGGSGGGTGGLCVLRVDNIAMGGQLTSMELDNAAVDAVHYERVVHDEGGCTQHRFVQLAFG